MLSAFSPERWLWARKFGKVPFWLFYQLPKKIEKAKNKDCMIQWLVQEHKCSEASQKWAALKSESVQILLWMLQRHPYVIHLNQTKIRIYILGKAQPRLQKKRWSPSLITTAIISSNSYCNQLCFENNSVIEGYLDFLEVSGHHWLRREKILDPAKEGDGEASVEASRIWDKLWLSLLILGCLSKDNLQAFGSPAHN